MQTVTSEDCGTFDFILTETQFITENESFINTCVSDVNTEQVNRWVVLPSRLQSVTASVLQFLHSTETSSWSADTQTSDQSADEPNGHSTGQEGKWSLPGRCRRSCDWCGWCHQESRRASIETWRIRAETFILKIRIMVTF